MLTYGFIETGDVLLSHNATIGRVAVVPELSERVLVGTSLTYYRVNPGRLLPRYLAAYFTGRDFQNQLVAVMSHSTRNQVPITAQRKLTVVVPPLKDQAEIADFLQCLDDKIELNRRMNGTLESLAGAIFKVWFIDFEPVRAKAAGATSFPGIPQNLFDQLPNKLTNSQLGLIPEVWEVGSLGDVMEHPRRTAKPNEIDPHTPYIGLEHMPRQCIALSEWGEVGSVTSNKHRFHCGELLFGKLRPYFHKVGIAPIGGVCSTDVVVVRPTTEAWFGFVLGHLSSETFVAYTNAASTGTKMPRTNWKDMSRYAVVVPSAQAAKAFSDIVKPLTERIMYGIHESRTLAAIRDALLPKLISGEIRVPDSGDDANG